VADIAGGHNLEDSPEKRNSFQWIAAFDEAARAFEPKAPDPAQKAREEIEAHEKVDSSRSLLARGVGAFIDRDSASLAKLKELNDEYAAAVTRGDAKQTKELAQKLNAQVKADQDAVNFKDEICGYGTGFLKTMGLFMRGRAGALGLGAYALDAVNPNDSVGLQLTDGALGYAKGFGLQKVFAKAGQLDAPLAVKGVSMGIGSRLVDLGLDRHNWTADGMANVGRQVFNKEALFTDVAVYGLAHGLIKGGNAMAGGLLERSPVLSTASTAFSFGLVSGTTAEVERQRAEGKTLSNLDFLKVAKVGGIQAILDAVASGPGGMQAHTEMGRHIERLTDNHRFKEIVGIPENMDQAVLDLKTELRHEVPVQHNGQLTNPYELVEADPLMTRQDKDLVWKTLATARESFLTMERKVDDNSPAKNYQWEMNWKHTRAEFGEAWEAAHHDDAQRRAQGLPGLTSQDIRDALITSMYSDHIKTPGPRSAGGNFIIHNIHGSEAAAEVLSHLMNPNNPADMLSIERIVRGIKEHQVAPPLFMAQMATHAIAQELGIGTYLRNSPASTTTISTPEGYKHSGVLASIYDKIAEPYNPANLTADLTKINFTPEERVYTRKVGIEDWYVPHPENGDDSLMAKLVVAADHSINYNTPDGLAKFAFIRQPGKEVIFQDPTFGAALDTVTNSFKSSREVLDDQFKPIVDQKFERSMQARKRTELIMDNLFKQTPEEQMSLDGQARLDKAMKSAAQQEPELFSTWQTPARSQAEADFMSAMRSRIGQKLDQWKQAQGLIPTFPDTPEMTADRVGKLPYWNYGLTYPLISLGQASNLSTLTPLGIKQFEFAKVISGIGQELLRAEHWRY
jgi:hypothetical protein